jgi:hypothetical protein
MPSFGADHDPASFEGFTRFLLEIWQRFHEVAVENHTQDGNLDGSGVNPDVVHHITGVVDGDQLLRDYPLDQGAVVMTLPTGVETETQTTAADRTTIDFSVSAWVSDVDQMWGLVHASIVAGNVVNNVESNRSLTAPDGTDPLAVDTTFVDQDFDFALNVSQNRHLKYATSRFRVITKRRVPR